MRFSLRTLLLLTTLCAILLALYIEPIQRQSRAAATVQQLGGRVEFGRNIDPPGPEWLRNSMERLTGEDYSQAPLAIYFGSNSFTDVHMKHIARMPNLRRLNLIKTQISSDGLPQLAELENLQELLLCGTQIDDQGLLHLKDLDSLQELYLNQTNVTEIGVRRLKQSLPNCKIRF